MSKLKDLYAEIWEEREHVCANCGYPLSRPIAHVFAHIRSKGARPDLKFDKDNIELLCSTLVRQDGEIGCHEAIHTKPSVYEERAKANPHNPSAKAIKWAKEKIENKYY